MTDFITVEEKTVEDALTEAKIILGAASDEIEYEIIEQGSKGFMGIGAKNAIIKARKKNATNDEHISKEPVQDNTNVSDSQKNSVNPETNAKVDTNEDNYKKSDATPISDAEINNVKNTVDAFLSTLFTNLNMNVKVEQEFNNEENSLLIELSGDEMGLLIGKRGQTLDSLQYITSLVANKNISSYVHIKIDTENYRERRKATLENLAFNIASKVRKTGRPVALEPMNPYERRVIHYSLQGDRSVATHSEGNEPYRKIIVTPKRRHH